jgi:hypothetical protein
LTAKKRAQALRLGAQSASHVLTLIIAGRLTGHMPPEKEAKLLQMWMKEAVG